MSEQKNNIIKSIVLSLFDDDGPTPKIYWPTTMDESSRLLIAMKTISLLMGDSVYQNGISSDSVNYFGILPFPDLKLNGLTYFFLILDPTARGNAKAATITILINEDDRVFFYENMKYLRVIIDKSASKVQLAKTLEENQTIMDELKEVLFNFTSEIKDPFSLKRQIKILMTGLDRAGKTSFLHAIKQRYSEIIKTLPTKGVARSEEKVFDEQNSIISLWDLGGQKVYREKFLEQRKVYLYNIDLLFYFIDIQDSERISEAIELFRTVINSLIELEEFPPIVVCLNKFDPDIKNTKDIKKNIKTVNVSIKEISERFFVKIFETSIFDHWSLISAYSYGLSQLSPNRELFENQLKNFAKKISSDAILLLNENGIILSNFSKIGISEKVFEISAPHFQTLYKTFKEFKLLQQDFLISSGITSESNKIIFKRIPVEKYNLYLLLFMEKELNIDKIDKNLPKLSKNLNELIQTYI
ncbi:MAG TPA: ADP-ribosylation factor-like protein [Candidatus Nanopelagicaceae bacterium]|nr:ADP-ribosylation factor-like protein [Candidatus Nanopelagicaceae bacterium]